MKKRSSPKPRDNGRRTKKKVSILLTEKVEYVDWKDVNLLRRFMSDRAKVRARRVTGNDAQQQRAIAKAIKNAREMALLPYTSRVTTQRGRRRDSDGDDERRPRGDRPDRGDRNDSKREFEPITSGGSSGDSGDEAPKPDAPVTEAPTAEVDNA